MPPDIRPDPRDSRYPAGPSFARELLTLGPLRHNAAARMLDTAGRFGDLNHYTVFGRHFYQLNHPDLIADFFLKDAPNHHRNLVMQRSRDVLGGGLLTSEEPLHMRQRRLMQPAFLRARIAAYADTISQKTLDLTARWQPDTTRDLHADMLELALRIVAKTLFDLDSLAAPSEPDNLAAFASAVDSFMNFVPLAFLPFSRHIQQLPIPAMRQLERGRAFLDTFIYRIIAERRADPTDRGDLLSMLLNATDPHPESPAEQGSTPSGNQMSDRQLRDECVTIILAGHETTANALSFALHLLAQHPETQSQLAAEALSTLGTRPPTAADYPALPLATQVFAESMRLFPPVWVTGRECAIPYQIAGYDIPVGAALLAPQFAVHRDPRFHPDPTRFDPTRFTEAARSTRPRYSYFPFAGGSRQCIAEGLAWMEGTLCLSIIARDWRLTPTSGTPATLALRPAVSLRPARGVHLHLARRSSASQTPPRQPVSSV